jgi:hypothetical protein
MTRKMFISFLIFSLVTFYLPRIVFSQVGDIELEITRNDPEMRATPAENIPVETGKKSKTWLWVLLGVVAVGAIVAVAAGGGGGGGGGGSSSTGTAANTGSASVGW